MPFQRRPDKNRDDGLAHTGVQATPLSNRNCSTKTEGCQGIFPHFGEFCKVFERCDLLLLTEIYAASEKPIPGVSGQSLAQGVQQVCDTPVQYFQTLDAMREGLTDILQDGDILLTLGAGSITRLGPAWLAGGKDA